MRTWFSSGLVLQFISLSVMADINCPNNEYESGYKKQLPVVDRQELINRSTPLFEGGKITCRIGLDYRNPSQNERLRVETGEFNKVKYRFYYTDGSGSIQGDARSTLDTIKDLSLTR